MSDTEKFKKLIRLHANAAQQWEAFAKNYGMADGMTMHWKMATAEASAALLAEYERVLSLLKEETRLRTSLAEENTQLIYAGSDSRRLAAENAKLRERPFGPVEGCDHTTMSCVQCLNLEGKA